MFFRCFIVLSICLLKFYAVYALYAYPRNLVILDTNANETNQSLLDNKLIQEASAHRRVKRQGVGGGAGKYAEAASVSQIKTLRLLLQLFKNFWSSSYIGGTHMFHPNVPKTFVALYKDKVESFFFPPVGYDPKKVGHV